MNPKTAAYGSAPLSRASLQLRRLIGRWSPGKPKPEAKNLGSRQDIIGETIQNIYESNLPQGVTGCIPCQEFRKSVIMQGS